MCLHLDEPKGAEEVYISRILCKIDDLGRLVLLFHCFENLTSATRNLADLAALVAVHFLFFLTAVVAHPLDTPVHGCVPVEPLVFTSDALRSHFSFVSLVYFRVKDRGEAPAAALSVDNDLAFLALI